MLSKHQHSLSMRETSCNMSLLSLKYTNFTLEFTNTFQTLYIKLGIKDSEWHLVLKYWGALHRYIQTEMDFLDISSLSAAYRYAAKIEHNFKH